MFCLFHGELQNQRNQNELFQLSVMYQGRYKVF